jgi:hypothetical protein
MRRTTVNIHRPQIALGGKQDGLAMQRWVSVVAAMQRRRVWSLGCGQKDHRRGGKAERTGDDKLAQGSLREHSAELLEN